jgi:hypothetical protein
LSYKNRGGAGVLARSHLNERFPQTESLGLGIFSSIGEVALTLCIYQMSRRVLLTICSIHQRSKAFM